MTPVEKIRLISGTSPQWCSMENNGFWNTIGDLAFPRWCAGCGAWDEDLCPDCQQRFTGPWCRVDDRAPYLQMIRPVGGGRLGLLRPGDPVSLFPVFALADYDDVVRKVIVSWKNTVNRGLTKTLVRTVTRCATSIEWDGGAVSIVPAPSRFRRRHDGRFVAGHLARALGAGIDAAVNEHRGRAGDVQISVARYRDVLATATISFAGVRGYPRTENSFLGGRGIKGRGIRVRRPAGGGRAILVDDVLTSGATLAGCARALKECDVEVVAAFVLGAALDPRRRRMQQTGNEMGRS